MFSKNNAFVAAISAEHPWITRFFFNKKCDQTFYGAVVVSLNMIVCIYDSLFFLLLLHLHFHHVSFVAWFLNIVLETTVAFFMCACHLKRSFPFSSVQFLFRTLFFLFGAFICDKRDRALIFHFVSYNLMNVSLVWSTLSLMLVCCCPSLFVSLVVVGHSAELKLNV